MEDPRRLPTRGRDVGTVEGIAIAIALTLVGAELAVPMAIVTFLAAFVPFIGATAAGSSPSSSPSVPPDRSRRLSSPSSPS